MDEEGGRERESIEGWDFFIDIPAGSHYQSYQHVLTSILSIDNIDDRRQLHIHKMLTYSQRVGQCSELEN